MKSKLFYTQAFALLLILLLLLLAVPWYSKKIPKYLHTKVQESLHEADIDWVSVRVQGRDVTLSGLAPSLEKHHKVIRLANEIRGIRWLNDKISPQEIRPYIMDIELRKEYVKLEGYVGSKVEKEKLLTYLQELYKEKKIIDKIDIGAGHPDGWTLLVKRVLFQLKDAQLLSLHMVDTHVDILGKINTEIEKDELAEVLKAFQGKPYIILDHLVAMDRPLKVCQEKFDNLLSNKKIGFSSNKSILSKKSNPLLKQLAEISFLCPQAKLEIVGYTDSMGSNEKNRVLSESRAKAVVAKLFQEGVDLSRLIAIGKGESSPLADNSTVEGRAKNRRIEFKVINKGI